MDSLTQRSSSTSETQLPARTITKHPADIQQINVAWVEHIEGLLKIAHQKMDDDNATLAVPHCRWCKGPWGYDENGIRHDPDCILLAIRKVVTV